MRKNSVDFIEKVALRVFFASMILCATLVITTIWLEWFEIELLYLMPLIPTLFIIGLASFLIWLPHVVYKVIESLRDQK